MNKSYRLLASFCFKLLSVFLFVLFYFEGRTSPGAPIPFRETIFYSYLGSLYTIMFAFGELLGLFHTHHKNPGDTSLAYVANFDVKFFPSLVVLITCARKKIHMPFSPTRYRRILEKGHSWVRAGANLIALVSSCSVRNQKGGHFCVAAS